MLYVSKETQIECSDSKQSRDKQETHKERQKLGDDNKDLQTTTTTYKTTTTEM